VSTNPNSFIPLNQPTPKTQADVTLPTDAESGVLATIGGRYSGWGFYLKDGCV
jgi:hypothetical protein